MMGTDFDRLKEIYHTQEALARALGVSNQTVYRWLHGITKPSQMAVARMRELLEKGGMK